MYGAIWSVINSNFINERLLDNVMSVSKAYMNRIIECIHINVSKCKYQF